jgi:hypothetical protein
MSEDNIKDVLDEIFPTSLDDIIRKNRHLVDLRLPTEAEITSVEKSLVITNLKGTFSEALLYCRVSPQLDAPILCLVGYHEQGHVLHTSRIVGFDPETNAVLTGSGSNYLIKNFIEGEPDVQLLSFICYIFHREGMGNYFGVPAVFY